MKPHHPGYLSYGALTLERIRTCKRCDGNPRVSHCPFICDECQADPARQQHLQARQARYRRRYQRSIHVER